MQLLLLKSTFESSSKVDFSITINYIENLSFSKLDLKLFNKCLSLLINVLAQLINV